MDINILPIYNIFFKYFTIIGLWALINEFLTVKGTAAKVGIPYMLPLACELYQKITHFAPIGH